MVSFGSTTYSKRLLHLISWSHWFTFFNIIAAIGLSSFYLISETQPETLLGQVYLITTWLSHMGFLTFMSFVLILFPITLIYPNTRFIRVCASIIFTIGLLLLLLDAFIYTKLGYHLNASSSDQIIALINTQIQQNSRAFWFASIILSIAILAFQLVVSNYAWKHLRDLQKTLFARYVVIFLVASFFFSHITHIWADANLEYDILRQDTVLPLSYPSTAKTLLTKYGMFNRDDYIERRTSPLSFTTPVPKYPVITKQCLAIEKPKESVFIVLSDNLLTQAQIKQFSQRSTASTVKLNNHIDNALPENAWFNLLYSLPTIYKDTLIKRSTKPLLFDVLSKSNLTKSLTIIDDTNSELTSLPWLAALFDKTHRVNDISNLIFANKLNNYPKGLHIIYFKSQSNYHYELFIDALMLAQKQKQQQKLAQDIIWISSIGNQSNDTSLSIKPALLFLPNGKNKKVNNLTSHMDVQPTLMKQWLGCQVAEKTYSSGKNILTLNNNRIIANTMDNGIVVFNKDKSVFIDQNGNFQSYSSQLSAPIMVSSDLPLMIDGVNFIKEFALSSEAKE